MHYDALHFIQSHSNDFLDSFFLAITTLGEAGIAIVIVTIMYWCVNKEFGKALIYSVLVSISINSSLKNIFMAPRPDVSADIRQVKTYSGYSFPSGHTQNASVTFTAVSAYTGKKIIYAISLIIIFLVALSRMYLGVHFPIDVLFGFLIGAGLAFFSIYINKKIENKLILNTTTLIMITTFAFVSGGEGSVSLCMFFVGYTFGDIIERKFVRFRITGISVSKKIIRFVIGIVVISVEYSFISWALPDNFITDSILNFTLTFTAVGVYPLTFKWLS